jgi:hypothetical protein
VPNETSPTPTGAWVTQLEMSFVTELCLPAESKLHPPAATIPSTTAKNDLTPRL